MKIIFNNNENWGIHSVFFGMTIEDMNLIQSKVNDSLKKLCEEKKYIEINISKIDFSMDGWAVMTYTYKNK